jgi:uncharacterized phage infection (PIP) family protein YhgE
MTSRDDFNPSQLSPRHQSQSYDQQYHQYRPPSTADNPPPPPPKPLSQDTSRIGTPLSNGPPTPLPSQQQSINSPRPQPPLPPTSTPSPSHQQHDHQLSLNQPVIPPPSFEQQWLPTAPPLSGYTTAQLIPVLNDPTLLSALATTHPSHASSLKPLLSAIDSNITAAQRLTQLESQLSALRTQTQQLLLQHATLSTQWRRKQSEMDSALSPWGPRAMYQRLVSAISEQENLVKAMQESFLEGEGGDDGYSGDGRGSGAQKASEKEVSEWVRRIREGTTTLERRREMRARWDEGRVGGWR